MKTIFRIVQLQPDNPGAGHRINGVGFLGHRCQGHTTSCPDFGFRALLKNNVGACWQMGFYPKFTLVSKSHQRLASLNSLSLLKVIGQHCAIHASP